MHNCRPSKANITISSTAVENFFAKLFHFKNGLIGPALRLFSNVGLDDFAHNHVMIAALDDLSMA